MIHTNEFITEVCSCEGIFAGPRIKVRSFKEAEKYCQENGLGYCKVIGKLYLSLFTFELN